MTEHNAEKELDESNMTSSEPRVMMKLTCPGCQSHLDVTDLEPFTVFACPRCGIEVKVPKRWQQFALEDCLFSYHGVDVYRALDMALDREVMIEFIPRHGFYSDEQLDIYLTVIRRLAGIVDSSLGAIYSCGQDDACVYSVSQYIPSMPEYVNAVIPWREVRPKMLALLELLKKASELGIVHGRINLQTLQMSESRTMRLTGFGMGMVLDNSLEFDGYTSPERVCGAVASMSGDIYSVGRVFWHWLAGRLPEEGGMLPDSVPGSIQELLKRMMSLAPSDRPRDYDVILAIVRESPETEVARKNGKRSIGSGSGGSLRLNTGNAGRAVGYNPRLAPSGGGHGGLYVVFFVLIVGLVVAIVLVVQRKDAEAMLPQKGTDGLQAAESSDGNPASSVLSGEEEKSVEDDDEENSGEAVPDKKIDASQDAMQQTSWKPLPDELREMRPRPKNPLVLQSQKVRRFMEALPEDYRHGIEIQAKVLDSLPEILMFYAKKNKYDRGEGTILQLRNSNRKVNACITMANDKGMKVKNLNSGQQDVPEHVTFHDLSRRTIMDMLDYYCDYSRQRLNTNDQDYLLQRKTLLKHYFALVMLADWYNERDVAQKCVNICRELQPENTRLLGIYEKYGYPVTAEAEEK